MAKLYHWLTMLYHSKTLYQKLYHWLTKLYHSETLYQSFIYKVTLTSIPTCSITCMFYIPGSKCALLMHIYTASVAISDSPTASVAFSDSPTASAWVQAAKCTIQLVCTSIPKRRITRMFCINVANFGHNTDALLYPSYII